MKNFQVITSTLITMFFCCILSAQCPEGDLMISTQQEVDNFALTYPNCTELPGSLVLKELSVSDYIGNLNALTNITAVAGDLTIKECHMSLLSGLENLTSIGGSLDVIDNVNLINMTALQSLSSVGGIEILDNQKLQSMAGLEGISSIEGDLDIQNRSFCFPPCPNSFTSLTGLENITSVEGYLRISITPAVTTLLPLANLTTVGGNMTVWFMDRLTTLEGLGNLTSVGGNLTISNNRDMEELSALEELSFVGGSLTIEIADLTSLAELGNLTTVGEDIIISSTDLTSLTGLEGISNVEGDLKIQVRDLTDLAALNNLTTIKGDCTIAGCDSLNDFTGLENLTDIGGLLAIGSPTFSYGNDNLASINGLENLVNVDSISIVDNDNLTNIGALENIDSLEGYLRIEENDALTTLTGLESINYVGGEIFISDNGSLLTLEGIENITSIPGSLSIHSNPNLETLAALQNITSIGYLSIRSNTSLTDLTGIENITSMGSFDLSYQDNLTSITGLENINSLNELIIYNNDNLTTLSGLENINSLNELIIYNNGNLTTLSGLENISTLNRLRIEDNQNLKTLSGLENIVSIDNLFIRNNDSLTTLFDFENLTSIGDLYIKDNSSLSMCHTQGICDYLGDNNASIQNNASGCNSKPEVQSNCGTLPPCPEGYIRIRTNEELSDFIALYPNCTDITGDLRIGGVGFNNNPGVSDFSALSQITSIGNSLQISFNDNLVDLTGLDNLTTIGGDLIIEYNNSLGHLTGLGSLQSIGGNLEIGKSQYRLVSLTGLEELTSIAGEVKIVENSNLVSLSGIRNVDFSGVTDLTIEDNYHLSVCNFQNICDYLSNGGSATISGNATGCVNINQINNACASNATCPQDVLFKTQRDVDDFSIIYPNCTQIPGSMTVSGANSNIQNFSPINQITTVGEDFTISNLDGISDLSDFSNISQVNGDLNIERNSNLVNLNGLSDINAGGELAIRYNTNLVDLSQASNVNVGSINISENLNLASLNGLNNIFIGNDVRILGNDALTNLQGMEHISLLSGTLSLYDNDNLTSLSGLENLNSIGNLLSISGNKLLTSISALANIDPNSLDFLSINDNLNLSECSINSICQYLESGGNSNISWNDWGSPGCNNQTEIEDNCVYIPPQEPCGGAPSTDSLSHIFDQDLFIDGIGFDNNPVVTFTDPATPADAVLSDISLELYFRLNGSSCENEIAIQITDPTGNTQALTAFTTCDGGNALYYVNLNVPSGNTTGSVADWVVEFDDTNDQNSDYEYSVRFARLNYIATTGGGGETILNEVSEFADSDLFIDGVGFDNNGTYTFTDPGTPTDAVLSDISLELYFRLNGSSCENEIAIQITDPAGNTQALTAYTTCDGGTGLYYAVLEVPNGNTTGSAADWVVEFDDTNDQNSDYEYSVRFGRLTYTTTHTEGGSGMSVTVNEQVTDLADSDLFIDGVGFANNDTYTFTDPGTPADAVLSNISLELYFRLNGNSCENEIAIQITDPAGNTQALTAYTTCDGGNGLYYINLDVPSGNTTGSTADWIVEFDDTNDQNSDYEYSVRFGRLTYDAEYTECAPMLVSENEASHQQLAKNDNSTTRQLNNSLKLYPVPARQHLNVECFSENTNTANIEILSNEGKMLMSKQEFLQEGLNIIQMDIIDLPAGHYHLRIYHADDMQVQSFVKIE